MKTLKPENVTKIKSMHDNRMKKRIYGKHDPYTSGALGGSAGKVGEIPSGEKSNSQGHLLKGDWKSKSDTKIDLNHYYTLNKSANEHNKFITDKGHNHTPFF